MDKKLKWGIIGLGNIAHTFAEDLLLFDGAELYGVASRSKEKAYAFKEKYGATKSFSSYNDLAKCEDIDVVYIATPHSHHFEHTMLCLTNNKSVLCEKAFAINSKQVELMMAEAKSRNLFLMEAFWTRFIPTTTKVLELLSSNILGDIKTIKSGFGFVAATRNRNRLTNNKLGGGTLLDIGIYPVFMSLLLKGLPNSITTKATLENNIDTELNSIFNYNQSKAFVESSFLKDIPFEVLIEGENGHLKIDTPFSAEKKLTLSLKGKPDESFYFDFIGKGYYYEIEEVTKCINNGQTESELLPLSFSLKLMNILDSMRKEIGLVYDADKD